MLALARAAAEAQLAALPTRVTYETRLLNQSDALMAWPGMDFYVVLDRAGYRVAKRRKCVQHVGIQHKVTKDDSIKWCDLATVRRLQHGRAACG